MKKNYLFEELLLHIQKSVLQNLKFEFFLMLKNWTLVNYGMMQVFIKTEHSLLFYTS